MNEQNGSKWYERAGESPEVLTIPFVYSIF